MPQINRKEFAELCGDTEKKLNVYISRLKVSPLAGNKKLIDTDNAINLSFIAERRRFNKLENLPWTIMEKPPVESKKKIKITPESTKIPLKPLIKPAEKDIEPAIKAPGLKIKPTEPKEIKVFEKKIAEQSARDERRVDQDMVKKGLEIENLELAKQQKMLQLNKSAGNLLPVDLVKGVLKRHGDTFFKSFEKSMERFISIIAGSDQEVYVKYLANVKDLLSKTITDAGKQAEAEIIILVNEFSETLARGQKKI